MALPHLFASIRLTVKASSVCVFLIKVSQSISVSPDQSRSVSVRLGQSQAVLASLGQSRSVSVSLRQSWSASASLSQSRPVSASPSQSWSVSISLSQSRSVSASLGQSRSVSASLGQSQSQSVSPRLTDPQSPSPRLEITRDERGGRATPLRGVARPRSDRLGNAACGGVAQTGWKRAGNGLEMGLDRLGKNGAKRRFCPNPPETFGQRRRRRRCPNVLLNGLFTDHGLNLNGTGYC